MVIVPPPLTNWHQFLESCTWPNLRVLEFIGDIPEGEGVMSNFIMRHPNIEQLQFCGGVLLRLPPGCLPNLQVLKSYPWTISHILGASPSSVLHTVKIELPLLDSTRVDLLANHLRGRPSLRNLLYPRPLVESQLQWLLDAVPTLEMLNGFKCTGDVRSLYVYLIISCMLADYITPSFIY